MNYSGRIIFLLLFTLSYTLPAQVSIQEWSKNKKKNTGFFNYFSDKNEDSLWLEINSFNREFLYVNSLTNAIGSNDIGLDRNQLGEARVVYFQRQGSKVFLVQPNLKYRAITGNKREKAAVREAFATSILYGFKIIAEENGRVIIDLTPFLLEDAHGVIQKLQQSNQGNYHIDKSRSALYFSRTKNFPKNTELEAILTFTGQTDGQWLQSVVPSPQAVSIHQHHSFVQLPNNQYQPRKFSPGCGMYDLTYKDYAQPIESPMDQRFVLRHRLRKKNPSAKLSEAIEPIIYYLDPGTPEPIRSALIEGASWWNQAFEAIGYKDAFQVKLLPADADPMDVRYNVINWTHRSTRGWSYGSSVVDPRTGEIIKGHVLLGSLRVRQDFLIAQGLIEAYPDGKTPDPRLKEMALARLRQLAAHEVGHTLGMQHNFAASTNKNSSVMDYPHPYIQLTDDKIDLSKAYSVGIGEWDKRTVLYGYQDYQTAEREEKGLAQILRDNIKMGFRYIQDRDARPQGGANAHAHLWDNGEDPVIELRRIIQLRQYGMAHFSEKNIPMDAPMSQLQDVFVPVYLMHRYQVEATVKLIGGYEYTYANRGDGQTVIKMVAHNQQRSAEQAILATLQPNFLIIPDHITKLIPPLPPGYNRTREQFSSHTGLIFDPLAAAETSIDHTLGLLLNPERLERLQQQYLLNPEGSFSVQNLLNDTHEICQPTKNQSRKQKTYAQIAENRFFHHLLNLLANQSTTPSVKGNIYKFIETYNKAPKLIQKDTHEWYISKLIQNFFEHPESYEYEAAPPIPAGSPIGCGMD